MKGWNYKKAIGCMQKMSPFERKKKKNKKNKQKKKQQQQQHTKKQQQQKKNNNNKETVQLNPDPADPDML